MDNTQGSPEPGVSELLAQYLRRPSVLLPLLGLVTFVVYSGSLSFDFVWDDWPQIVNSPIIRSWNNLPRAFGSDLWYHVARHQVYYRPLFVAWSMLNYTLFGLRPWGWHLGAVLLHIGAVAAVFWLSRKLGLEYWTAALTALVFALHPVHIEPVTWVSAASDTMVTIFAALAFGAFLSGRDPGPHLDHNCKQRKGTAWWIASMALLACALLTKEMAVVFSVLVGLYAWLHPAENKASPGKRVLSAAIEAAPYALVTLAYALLRKHALLHATGQFDPTHGMIDVARTLPLVLAVYLRQLLVPVGITGLYYTPYVASHLTSAALTQIALPVAVLCAALAGLWYWNRREGKSIVAFAGLWLLVGLSPALYLRNFGNGDFVRDRYIYLPSIGFAILMALGLRHLPSVKQWSTQSVQVCAVILLCGGYACASIAQQVYWGNDLLLLVHGQALYPGNPYTMAGLAKEYSQRGANDRAIELAEAVVREHPEYGYGPLALAESYIRAGRFDEGRVWLERVNPDYAKSEMGMAGVAALYGQMGDYPQALALCSEVLEKEPNLYSALYNCGNIHLVDGQYKEAEQLLARAVQLVPEQAAPKHFLGRALLKDGQNAEAQPYLRQAVAMDPKVWDYHYWLAESLEQSGKIAAARAEYQQALQLNQSSTEARLRLAALEGK
ncbi:MAG TPA: tetratricopeptide repeat protein [Terriglobales bacterium]|jgi:tetratricopeptide (TPR) repeat protein|nr:tetratricopeptide repeat protein [Terriglobales bacterium]